MPAKHGTQQVTIGADDREEDILHFGPFLFTPAALGKQRRYFRELLTAGQGTNVGSHTYHHLERGRASLPGVRQAGAEGFPSMPFDQVATNCIPGQLFRHHHAKSGTVGTAPEQGEMPAARALRALEQCRKVGAAQAARPCRLARRVAQLP